jgi:hypothetical protein
MTRLRALAAISVALLISCKGQLLEPDGGLGGPGPGNGGVGTGGTGIGPDPGPNTPRPPDPATCTAKAQPLRRLSHVEYRNTLADLFPTVTVPPLELVADESIEGFTNNVAALNPSNLLLEQYWTASRAVVEALEPTLDDYLSCDPGAGISCAESFIRDFGRRAFRRPLAPEEIADFRAIFEKPPAATNFRVGMQLAIQALLASPAFLYRTEFGSSTAGASSVLSGYETASRLSYFLWSTMPDDALFAAAEQGKLADTAGVEAEVRRMLGHEKARSGMLNFHREWLKLEAVDKALKKPEDAYDAGLRAELKQSVERFVWETLFARPGSAKELMTAASFPATTRIAELLGAAPIAPGTWSWTAPNAAQRSGVLTHPAFLSSHGYARYPSPVLRGVYVLDRILCSPPRPPPPGVNAQIPDAEASPTPRTNRETYAEATKGELCMTCHTKINALGFAFENFDTMGRFRSTDNGFPVDASGAALGLEFDDAVSLSTSIGDSVQYRQCLVQKWTTYAVGGGPLAADQCLRAELLDRFAQHGFGVKELVVAIATHPKFSRQFVAAAGVSP